MQYTQTADTRQSRRKWVRRES